MKKKSQLKIDIVQEKPHRTYKVEIKYRSQIKELASFIRNNQDKKVSFVINDKHIKFNTVAGKKRFATGFEQGGLFNFEKSQNIYGQTNNLKIELNKIKAELIEQKEKTALANGKVRASQLTEKLREVAWANCKAEINEDREVLKIRLEKVEPIIKLIKEANTEGQLQTAHNLAKKLKI